MLLIYRREVDDVADLIRLYEERLKGIVITTEEQMIDLLKKDEKTFYYLLMYFYLNGTDLGNMIRYSSILANCITLFCDSCNDEKIIEYFSKYLDLTEIPIQIGKIYNELKYREV